MTTSGKPEGLTRREAIATGTAAAAALATVVTKEDRMNTNQKSRMPVAFVPHGGGPWPFVDMGMDKKQMESLAGYLRGLARVPKEKPRAMLVISAHWEEDVLTVMTSSKPPILYDYYGFPPASYDIQWPAPGHPELAARVQELLGKAGFPTRTDSKRGFDHGTFIPFKLTWPDADVPTIQLSLHAGLDPAQHLAIGRALAPLRDEGVFIVGSGMSFHNLRMFSHPRANEVAEQFDQWLRDTTTMEPAKRDEGLKKWEQAPAARMAHPREEHLIPLMVIAGAAGEDRGVTAFSDKFMNVRVSAYQFG